jgi:protein-tyrosine phosphatase
MRAEIYPIVDVPVGRLAIMPRSRAGDWLADEIESWQRSGGLHVVVSLLEEHEIAELGLEEEPGLCRQASLEFVHFPICDRDVPASIRELSALVERVVSHMRENRGVGIHCRVGVGRAALVAACVLVALGQSAESAWSAIRKARGLSVPDTEEQRAWVARWATTRSLKV